MKRNHFLSGSRNPHLSFLLFMIGVASMTVAALLLFPVSVQAQCGGGTSSCQTCHEAEGEFPVSNLGNWHSDHVPGYFCTNCHAGDNTQSSAGAAHVDMVDPLADPTQRCESCHKDDTEAFAQRYKALLESSGAWDDVSVTTVQSSDPLDAPVDPLDAPMSSEPLDSPVTNDPLDAPAVAQPPAQEALAAETVTEQTGNRILVLLAEGLFIGGIGLVWVFERKHS